MKNEDQNPVEIRWTRLVREFPEVPRDQLHAIFMAGVNAHADKMQEEVSSAELKRVSIIPTVNTSAVADVLPHYYGEY